MNRPTRRADQRAGSDHNAPRARGPRRDRQQLRALRPSSGREYAARANYGALCGRVLRAVSPMAAAERPDIILVDLEMPVVDGWNAPPALRSNQQTRDIPVIALSAHALAGERERALAAGCNEFDSKPIEFDRLVATLRRILAERK